jgi:hypothetical protein
MCELRRLWYTYILLKKIPIHISERVLVFIFIGFFRASSVAGSGASDTDAPNNNVQGAVKWAQQIVLLTQIIGNSINAIF